MFYLRSTRINGYYIYQKTWPLKKTQVILYMQIAHALYELCVAGQSTFKMLRRQKSY